ncbi:hypothetical protein M8818_004095 [Zalaria obscura]|uniref:Uncharacterized protein n=1 Tax=Zalaria obscura TaxID=2024903 RepID=A0ACC3SCX5_9PEZI
MSTFSSHSLQSGSSAPKSLQPNRIDHRDDDVDRLMGVADLPVPVSSWGLQYYLRRPERTFTSYGQDRVHPIESHIMLRRIKHDHELDKAAPKEAT